MKRIRRALGLLVLTGASAGAVSSGGSASATDQYAVCERGYFCLFKNANWEGPKHSALYDRNSMSGTGPGNDSVSSGFNRLAVNTAIAANTDCRGDFEIFTVGQAIANLGEAAYDFNDRTSSIDIFSQDACTIYG